MDPPGFEPPPLGADRTMPRFSYRPPLTVNQAMRELEPMHPEEGVSRFLEHKEGEYSAETHREMGYSLQRFLEWCEDEGIENLNVVTGRTVSDYTKWRKQSVKPATVKTDIDRVRVMLRYCETLNAVDRGLADTISSPQVADEDEVRTVKVTTEEAEAILDYLETFEYASFRHTLFLVLWHTQMRMGSAHALDVEDFREDRLGAYLDLQHRPKTGTPLKNKLQGEREIGLSDEVAEVLNAYITYHRANVVEDSGREPLFATQDVRAGKTTIQRNIYSVTRPCYYNGGECPYDYDPAECEFNGYNTASQCPGSKSPHAVRRGSIQKALDNGARKDNVADRANVSTTVLDKHYDTKEKKQKRERRRRDLDKF